MSLVYPHPVGIQPSDQYRVLVDGQEAFVHDCQVGSIVAFEVSQSTEVWIHSFGTSAQPTVRPVRLGLGAVARDAGFQLTISGPQNLYIEFGEGVLPLFLFANPPESNRPDPDDPKVHFFEAGKVHEPGQIELKDDETLYLEGGAVVRGSIYAHGTGISIRGHGVIDATGLPEHSVRLIVFDGCRDVKVEGLITIGTPSWNLVLGACQRVEIDNVKLIGWVVSSDGIDVVGSRDVTIRNCFLRNNDDCVAIKAVHYQQPNEHRTDWRQDVERILIEQCTLYNDRAGNVMEIGYDTQTEWIRDITFRDIDVLAGHGEGGVFTIHNGDRATVTGVLYENIRDEHFYDKLIDFRIMNSRCSKDIERGRIQNVRFRNIQTVEDRYNCISLMGGFDDSHEIENVVIEDFKMGQRRLECVDELGLYVKHATGVKIK